MCNGSGEKVNIMVNKKLKFFPDTIKILTKTIENTYTAPVNRQKTPNYILKKSPIACDDPFIYAVPWSTLPLQVCINNTIDCKIHSKSYARKFAD